MKPIESIENLVRELFATHRLRVTTSSEMDRRVLNDALMAYEKSERARSTSSRMTILRAIFGDRLAKLSAAAIIIAISGLFIFLGRYQTTLYARVLNALEQARTFHGVMKEYRDGQLFKNQEVWYDREAGIAEQEQYEKRIDVRIDNGQYEWRYAIGHDIAARVNTYRDSSEIVRKLCGGWCGRAPKRNHSGDMDVNGVPCKMYKFSEGNWNLSIWTDNEDRMRLIKSESSGEFCEKRIMLEGYIEYDIVIDRTRFSAKFNSNVKVVDPRQMIEEQFPLGDAAILFTKESLGLVFAVHKLEYCEGGFKYLICSTRLSSTSRQEIGTGHPWTYYGQSDPFTRYDKFGIFLETSDSPLLLARLSHDGVQVSWYALLPGGSKAKEVNSCDVDVIVNVANQLEEKRRAENLPIRERFRLNLPIKEPKKQQLSLAAIIDEIYSLGERVDPLVHSFLLTRVVTGPDGREKQTWHRPTIEMPKGEYTKDIWRRVSKWLENGGQ